MEYIKQYLNSETLQSKLNDKSLSGPYVVSYANSSSLDWNSRQAIFNGQNAVNTSSASLDGGFAKDKDQAYRICGGVADKYTLISEIDKENFWNLLSKIS